MQAHSGEDELTELHRINVTPFIAVRLVLPIIFMVAAPLATVDIAVDLPSSAPNRRTSPDKPVYLTLKPDLTLAVGDTPLPALTLPAPSRPQPAATTTSASSCAPTAACPMARS